MGPRPRTLVDDHWSEMSEVGKGGLVLWGEGLPSSAGWEITQEARLYTAKTAKSCKNTLQHPSKHPGCYVAITYYAKAHLTYAYIPVRRSTFRTSVIHLQVPPT